MRPRRPAIALSLALVVLALTLAACGGGDDEPTTTTAPSADAPSGGAAPPSLSAFPPEFLKCLEDQGIDLESVTDISAVIHSPQGDRCFDELHGG
jgi:hypothetical protein